MRLQAIPLPLIALALLAGFASPAQGAAVPELRCTEAPCQYRIEGGSFYLRLSQLKIGCQAARGVGEMESSANGTTRISFSGCREEVTPFAFGCLSGGLPLGTIETSALSTSTIADDKTRALVFGGEMSFICGGIEKALHIEGYLSGEMDPRECDVTQRRFPIRMKLIAHGREGSGPNYDVYVDGYGGEQYDLTPPWRLTFESSATFDC